MNYSYFCCIYIKYIMLYYIIFAYEMLWLAAVLRWCKLFWPLKKNVDVFGLDMEMAPQVLIILKL